MSRALGIRQGHIAPTLNEGMQAVIVVGDVSQPVQAKQRLAFGATRGTGTAGNSPAATLYIPPTLDRYRFRIVCVTAFCSVASEIRAHIVGSAGPAVNNPILVNPAWEDRRLAFPVNTPLPQAGIYGGDFGVSIPYYWASKGGAFQAINWCPQGLILVPGQQLVIATDTAGINTLTASFEFIEEPNEDLEGQ